MPSGADCRRMHAILCFLHSMAAVPLEFLGLIDTTRAWVKSQLQAAQKHTTLGSTNHNYRGETTTATLGWCRPSVLLHCIVVSVLLLCRLYEFQCILLQECKSSCLVCIPMHNPNTFATGCALAAKPCSALINPTAWTARRHIEQARQYASARLHSTEASHLGDDVDAADAVGVRHAVHLVRLLDDLQADENKSQWGNCPVITDLGPPCWALTTCIRAMVSVRVLKPRRAVPDPKMNSSGEQHCADLRVEGGDDELAWHVLVLRLLRQHRRHRRPVLRVLRQSGIHYQTLRNASTHAHAAGQDAKKAMQA